MRKLFILIVPLFFSLPVLAQNYTVTRVIDGDTLMISGGTEVHLLGIDCPESINSPKAREESRRTGTDINVILQKGQEAKAFSKKIVDDKEVRLVFETQKEDEAGDLWAYVFIPICEWQGQEPACVLDETPPEGTYRYLEIEPNVFGIYEFLNAMIMYYGYASPLHTPPDVMYGTWLKDLYEDARENRRGLWQQDPERLDYLDQRLREEHENKEKAKILYKKSNSLLKEYGPLYLDEATKDILEAVRRDPRNRKYRLFLKRVYTDFWKGRQFRQEDDVSRALAAMKSEIEAALGMR